ncbi:hypothetical protein L6452_13026 [Arctium lappa]|uniref:Uncharacterized protein n=1 Tax=Arctium lappa TaxID=4217 RepID=A0ACB9CH27_ARCLA|nr:hypothetical protein L6452_13026 [Arctium lappa]
MELIKLSKFKLQLQTLITEVRELRVISITFPSCHVLRLINHHNIIDNFQEKERDSSDQLHDYVQKQKQHDEEFCRKRMELEVELASSNELCQKLDRKVHFLEDENYLLESKHKELKETINSILQSKEGFVKAYQESICEMKRSIEFRDRKIAMLSEKINAHLLSFDTIQKEASFVKQVVDNAQSPIITTMLAMLVEKINDLETKLASNEIELKRKDRDGVAFSIMLANQEKDKEYNRTNHDIKDWEANSHHEACRATVSEITVFIKSAFPPPSSAHLGSQPAANPNLPGAGEKDNCSNFMQQLDSECSTTQAGTS